MNLDFENTTITTVHFPGGDRYTATVPGWAWNTGNNFVDGDPNSVALNDIALSAPAVTLHGADSFFPAIQENFSVLLQGGMLGGFTNGASVFQTGQIPVTSQSLTYLGWSALQVSFNGQTLSSIAISNAPSYTVWGVDVSAHEGESGELRFTAPWRSRVMLDDIEFSPAAVPEPSTLALCSIFAFFLFWAMKRPDSY